MNFDGETYKLIRAWLHAHVNFIGEVTRRMKTVSDRVGHQFDGDEEYVITPNGVGYHVELDVNIVNGVMKYIAVPGRFVPSNVGHIWVNGKTRMHSEIEKNCDQQETSLIIQ